MEPAHQFFRHSDCALMKPGRNLVNKGLFLALAACLLHPVGHPLAQEAGPKTDYSRDPADQQACQRQLNMIYGAIQEYTNRHDNTLPAKLSDLIPDYIYDPNVLICPFVQKRGGLRTWRKKFREISHDPYTSYSYEFSPVPLDLYLWRGLPKKTWRDFKLRVAEELEELELGPVVPIVRCHDHRPWLNLAVGGRIYESKDILWEKNFTTNDNLLTVARVFTLPARARLRPEDLPPRDPQATTRQLDLTDYYNAALTNSWQGFPGNHLAALPTGLQEFGGIRFDVRGLIQLSGTELPAPFPRQVAGVKVQQRCRRIHFLHALGFVSQPGATNAFYAIHYADGRVEEFPLVYGQQIADWWCDPRQPAEPTNAPVAWRGENQAATAYGMALCLYRAVWENPFKDTEIATISLDAGRRKYPAGLFVVAITLE